MPCLDESELAEYIDGVLPADRLAAAEAHIDACPSCYQLVVQALAADDPRRARNDAKRSCDVSTLVDRSLPSNAESSHVLAEAPSRYAILELRGRGGQASVYAAYDEYLHREIALKVIEQGADDSKPPRREVELRFLREIGIASQLVHPSIVHVYDAGKRADGSLFYTMQLVQGTTLSRALAAAPSLSQRLSLLRNFVDVCNAVAYAHSRGVLHRDIKPTNVMLGEFGETVVLDWGLAKTITPDRVTDLSTETSDNTLEGTVFGTPRYMSPEQASGGSADERSDTWALGVVLFEILTGKAPYEGESASAVLRAVRDGASPRVRVLSPQVPAELADIADKALRREPAERYQSAKQLADDVVAYMTGRRVDAHDYSAWEVARRFALRHKAAVSAALLVLLTFVVASVLVLISYRNERSAHERESSARVQERDARLQAQLRLSQSFATKARILGEEQDLLASRIFAAASLKNNPAYLEPAFAERHPESRMLLAEARSALLNAESRPIRSLSRSIPADGILYKLAVTPDGARLAGVGLDDGFRLWDLASGALIADARAKDDEHNCIAVSPSGEWFVTGGFAGKLVVRSSRSGELIRSLPGHTDTVRAVAFSASGRLASGGHDGTVRLWNSTDWQTDAVLAVGQQIAAIAWRPRTDTIAVGGRDGTVQIWDTTRKRALSRRSAHADPIEALAYSLDGTRLVSGSEDKTARVWNANGGLIATLEPHQEAVIGVSFSPDGRWIATNARDGLVRLWHAGDHALAQVLAAHGETYDAVFSQGGTSLLTSGVERAVRQWDISPSAEPPAFRGHKGIVFSVAFSRDGRMLASAGIDATARVWDARTGAELFRLAGHEQPVMHAVFSPDGTRVLSASRDRTVRAWSTTDGHLLSTWTASQPVYALAVSPDGTLTAMAGLSGPIELRPNDGRPTAATWDSNQGRVYALAFTADGATLASAGADGTVRFWDTRTHEQRARIEVQKSWVTDVKYSPDERWIGVAGKEGCAAVYETASRTIVHQLKGHRQWVNEIAFAPVHPWAATSSDDKTAILWDVREWEPLLVLPLPAGASSVDFSPDGTVLVAASAGPIHRWRLDLTCTRGDPEAILREAQRTAGQVLDGVRLEPGSAP